MYSSSVRIARSPAVCGVTPVEVNEAAAFPLVYLAALYGVSFGFCTSDARSEPGLCVVAMVFAFVPIRLESFLSALALATASFALSILAEFAETSGLTMLAAPCASDPAARDSPFRRYLNRLRSLDSKDWGYCKVMMSFREKPSSLTRSLQFFALMFSLSTVSHAKTFPVFFSATIWVLSVNTLKVTGSTRSPSSFFA